MEPVTLVGMRPRAVGNPIENLCSVVGGGSATDGNLDTNRLPSLAVAAGVTASTGKPAVSTGVQQIYDEQDTVDHKHSNRALGNDFEHNDIIAPNPMTKPIPARLPAIQNGGGSKTDLSGGVKRSLTSVIVPMSPEMAMKLYMHKLAAYEQHEIFDYPKVWWNLTYLLSTY